MARRVTAADVAARARASVSSVSLFVNGKADGRLSPSLQQRIATAVAELGYIPDSKASALASGRPSSVGFVCPDVSNPFFAIMLGGLAQELGSGLELALTVPAGGHDYDLDTVVRTQKSDLAALLLASPADRLVRRLQVTCPTVLLDAPGLDVPWPCVSVDIAVASRQLAEHLVSLGHRRVAYLGLDRAEAKTTLRLRRGGIDAVLQAAGGQPLEVLELSEASIDSARGTLDRSWDRLAAAGVSAIVCEDDQYAYGCLSALAARGISVPGDVSVAAFNDLPYSALVRPSLTTVHFPIEELGIAAGEVVNELAAGRMVADRLLAAPLVERGSTGPASS